MARLNAFAASRRRTLVVSIIGSALLAGGAIPLLSNVVAARGPEGDSSPYAILSADRPWSSQGRSRFDEPSAPTTSAASEHRSWAGGQAVCVRLCDGGFFPISTRGDTGDEEAACSALCPDAPVALYHEQSGSDKIEDAVSTKGAPYTALPVALRYRTTLDNTCACHRARSLPMAIARDATLRKGDYVMTANGLVMYTGAKGGAHGASEFTAIAGASMPAAQKAALMAIEKASQTGGDGSPVSLEHRAAASAPALSISALQHPQGPAATSN
jgi:hypothetical protein